MDRTRGQHALTNLTFSHVITDIYCSCFGLTAYGGPGGTVRQLSDGQNRIGDDSLPAGKYCLDKMGGVTDGKSRGCILTPPTTQWQCDQGATPDYKMDLTCDGDLTHDGDTTWYSCPTEQNNGWNLYSKPLNGEPKCVPVWLRADSCYDACEVDVTSTTTLDCPKSTTCTSTSTKTSCTTSYKPATSCTTSTTSSCTSSTTSSCTSSKPKVYTYTKPTTTSCSSSTSTSCSSSKPTTSCTSSTAPKKTCPAYLSGDFEFPHLIIPVNKYDQDAAYGTQFNGSANKAISSYFNFDIPKSAAGKTCYLDFYLPEQSQLETSAFELYGDATFSFATAYPAASKHTTYSSSPKEAYQFGDWKLEPGNAYRIGSHECPAGDVATFKMSAVGNSYINYFQDYNPCPIGVYIVVE